MGLLDSLIGGVVGAEGLKLVNGFVEGHGGLQGIVAQMEKNGLGSTVQSWIGNGPNQPISADQVHQVFNADILKQTASGAGMSTQDLAGRLASMLPQVIDRLTPNGKLPQA